MMRIHPLAEIFPALEGEAFEALKADLAANPLHDKIALWGGAILDGRNRFRALVELRILGASGEPLREGEYRWQYFRHLDAESADGEIAIDPLAYVISKNLTRRHLSESQRAMVAARLANMGHGGARRGANLPLGTEASSPSEPSPSPRPADAGPPSPAGGEGAQPVTIGAAAEMLSVSPRAVKDARALFRGPIQLVEDVQAGRLPVSRAARALRAALAEGGEQTPLPAASPPPSPQGGGMGAEPDAAHDPAPGAEPAKRSLEELYSRVKARLDRERAERIEAKKARREAREADLGARLSASNESLAAMGASRRYGVILADPEWRFETFSEAGKDRSAENHYPCSSLDDIKARPVSAIAAEDCLLLLWATAPMLPQALEVMAAWGFTYRSHLIWAKDRPGTGYWARNQHELLLIGARGSFPAPAPGTQPPSVLDWPVGRHSEKPPFAHEFAERCWPSLPKIELNARAAREGWDAWGAEIDVPPSASPPTNLSADGDPGSRWQAETPPPGADAPPSPQGGGMEGPGIPPAALDAEAGGAEGGGPDDDSHPDYGPDYNRHGVLRIAPAERLTMPPVKGKGRACATISLHPFVDGGDICWLWATDWTAGDASSSYAIAPKWLKSAPTRDAACRAACAEIADAMSRRFGLEEEAEGVEAKGVKAILAWLATLDAEAGGDGSVPARAAAKGRLARRKAIRAPARPAQPETAETEGEAA